MSDEREPEVCATCDHLQSAHEQGGLGACCAIIRFASDPNSKWPGYPDEPCSCVAFRPFVLNFKANERGWPCGTFTDYYGEKCSVQDSSLATRAAMWLGIDEPVTKILVPDKGWQVVEQPAGSFTSGRMHLTIPMAIKLREVLDRFIETGSVKP